VSIYIAHSQKISKALNMYLVNNSQKVCLPLTSKYAETQCLVTKIVWQRILNIVVVIIIIITFIER